MSRMPSDSARPWRRERAVGDALPDVAEMIAYGVSPRASIGLLRGAQALALLRGRRHVTHDDVRDLAPDVLRHRLVLSYDALAYGVKPDDVLARVLEQVRPQERELLAEAA